MTNIMPFAFGEQPVRVEDRDGETWFVAADVCTVLEIAKHRDAVARLDEDETSTVIVDTPGGPQRMAAISESGLFALILRSRKPAARRFRKFVTAEVLPTIRRTGSYGAPAVALDLRDPSVLHRLLLDHTNNAMAAEARVEQLEPKAEALDRLTLADGSLCITDAAKALGVPPRRLFAWMEAHGWIYRRADAGQYVAYQARLDAGTLEHKGKTIQRRGLPDKWVEQVMVTTKGLTKLATEAAGA